MYYILLIKFERNLYDDDKNMNFIIGFSMIIYRWKFDYICFFFGKYWYVKKLFKIINILIKEIN